MIGIEPGRPAEENPPHGSISSLPATPPERAATAASQPPTDVAAPEGDSGSESDAAAARRKILIGSQRDPAASLIRRQRDWIPVDEEGPERKSGESKSAEKAGPIEKADKVLPAAAVAVGPAQADRSVGSAGSDQSAPSALPKPAATCLPAAAPREGMPPPAVDRPPTPAAPPEPLFPEPIVCPATVQEDNTPVIPGRRQKLSATMEAELDQAMAGMSLDDLMAGGDGSSSVQEAVLEPDSRHRGRVVALRRDEIFIEFSGREQGCLSSRTMEKVPQPGDMIDIVVQRYNAEEGLYDLSLPGASFDAGNWDEVQEGMIVDAQITGHNTGGLECEVNKMRGFIPVSQVSLYRVEDMAQFVGQRFACLITEANASRKNLVLSRRAVLEREKEETKKAFFENLAPGQVYEGTVRKLMDFGAFVELGNGVDGLLHISQLSWGRIKHPSEVLQEGQPVRVRVEKVDRETGRIGLSYREMIENPWTAAASKYPHNAMVRGKVTRLMDFGAFVELEPGIEGLVHISELSHKRIWRASDVVKEGEEVDVIVLNVNPEAQRMSLSIKGLSKPEPTKKEKEEAQEAELPAATKKPSQQSNVPLKGGLKNSAGGESFGLKW